MVVDTWEKDVSQLGEEDHFITIPIQYRLGMRVPGKVYVRDGLRNMLLEEVKQWYEVQQQKDTGKRFIPALHQIANVATMPGIVGASIALPDVHSGYGFAIGNVAAFDMDDPVAVVSPGGVGYDIGCGVRMLKTRLLESEVRPFLPRLVKAIFDRIPMNFVTDSATNSIDHLGGAATTQQVVARGLPWAIENGLAWEEDQWRCEDNGYLPINGPVHLIMGQRATGRGGNQLGTLGSGNHYVEVQAVTEIYDIEAARALGIDEIGQVCVMIHSGSRGLGHQVASDSIKEMDKWIFDPPLVDRQLSCAPISSDVGKKYLVSLAGAGNFATCNRAVLGHRVREAFADIFKESADDLEMNLVYDVSHNLAKPEVHMVNGAEKRLLVHRKGATRAFGPSHPSLSPELQAIGQPVLVGGSMGTASYLLLGTEGAMQQTFGSTCHGAGRALGRNAAKKQLNVNEIRAQLEEMGVVVCVASPDSLSEEAPQSYKDVDQVVQLCHDAGISRKVAKMKPIGVVKG